MAAPLFQAIRGMHDILPAQMPYWHFVEESIAHIIAVYGYEEIRFPILEKTGLFKRSIGEVTDIVEKEMYTFSDRNNDSLSLRPEGTASCVRAGIEQGLLYNQIQRLWYLGPMFRHERPQKGRCRQFHHWGVETFGMPGPEIDAELILMTTHFWKKMGLTEHVSLQLNSLGSLAARAEYRRTLVHYFEQHISQLDEDSQRRLSTNPLRILDSKNPALVDIIQAAPQLVDYLDIESKEHLEGLKNLLDAAHISYEINPLLVRGLDYYNRTVFEWVTTELGAQGTVCAGGRYDGLVEQLGGKETTAVGFAMGLERVVALLEETNQAIPEKFLQVYLISHDDIARGQGLLLAEKLREKIPGLRVMVDCSGSAAKTQFKRAVSKRAMLVLEIASHQPIELKILNPAGNAEELITLIRQVL